ncbi:MAG: hypothetical protein WCL30_02085 [Pseudomonadota bacterium]
MDLPKINIFDFMEGWKVERKTNQILAINPIPDVDIKKCGKQTDFSNGFAFEDMEEIRSAIKAATTQDNPKEAIGHNILPNAKKTGRSH